MQVFTVCLFVIYADHSPVRCGLRMSVRCLCMCVCMCGCGGCSQLGENFLMVSSARMLRDQTAAATAAATRESCESRRPLRKTKVANYALLLSLLSSILSFLSTLYSPLSSLTLQAFNAIRFDAAFFAVSSVHPPVASSLHLTVCLPPPLPPPSLSLCLAHCRAHISPLLLPSQLAVNTKYNCLTVHKNEEIKDPFVCVHRVSIELHNSNNKNNDLNSSSNPQQQQLNSKRDL